MPSGIHAILSEEKCGHLRGELEDGYLPFFIFHLQDVEVITIQV